ncbi:translocation/assembly module TamB domain-containing protein [Chitinophagaceae bacterium MMS25-I14]
MRKFLKILLYILGVLLIVIAGAVIWLQTPSGKRFVKNKALSYLRGKLKTEVQIGSIDYRLPKMIELQDVLFKDQSKDTLLSARKLRVDINMLALISKKVVVQKLELEGIRANVNRTIPDTNYNYTYIINAFTGTPKAPGAKDVKKANDTSSSLSFDVDKINLKDIHIRFDDYTGGMRLALDLATLNLSLKKVDPSKMEFGIKKLYVDGLKANFSQDTSYLPPKTDTTPSQPLRLAANEIEINKTSFTYNNNLSKFLFDIKLGNLLLQPKTIDLEHQLLDIKKLGISNTSIKISMGKKAAPPQNTTASPDTTSNNWRVFLANNELSGISFKMDDENSPRQKSGMDYSHLNVQNLALNAEDVSYTADTISGDIKHFTAREQSGFNLYELRTRFAYHSKGAYLRNLFLQTDQTILRDYLEIGYPSLASLRTRMQDMQLKVNLQKSIVGFKDLLVFVPTLQQQEFFRKNRNGHLKLEATLLGTLGNLDIKKMYIAGLGRTEAMINGKLRGLPESNNLVYDLNIQKLQSSRNDLEALLPAGVQQQFRLPDAFGITGHVTGTIKDYHTQLMLVSTDGNAYINGFVMMSPGKNRERYDMYLRADRLNLGRILKKEDQMGAVTANLTVKGYSFDVKTMTASVQGAVQSASFNGYTYNHIQLKGNVARKQGKLDLTSADPNLRMALNATASFREKYPAILADLNIDSADLQKLKLYDDQFKLRAKIHADIPVLNMDYPQATVVINHPTMLLENKRYFLDSMYLVSAPGADSSQHIELHTKIAQARIEGHTPLSRIGDIIQEHISRHYAALHQTPPAGKQKGTAVASKTKLPASYDLSVNAVVQDGPMLHAFLPDLKVIDTVHIDATINPQKLTLNAGLARLVYGNNHIRGVQVNVDETDSALTYKAYVRKFSQSKIQLVNTSVSGQVNNNLITANVNIKDDANKDRFALSATLQQQGKDNVLELGNHLLLDYKEWTVASPNKIVFASAGFYIQNFAISSNDESISINSESPTYNAPLTASIKNFHLADITKMISKSDTLLADGTLNGDVKLQQIKPEMMLQAQLQIKDLAVLRDTIGDLTVNAHNTDASTINTDVALKGHDNDITIKGNYYMQPVSGNSFELTLALNALSLKSVEGLAMGQIKNSSGYLRGQLQVKGTTAAPAITGELRTDQLVTTVSMLNADYHMPSEKITLSQKGLTFNNFNILDSAGNKLTISGDIVTQDMSNITLDLSVKARQWRVLHSTAKDNKIFYGDVYLTTNINITGDATAPDIDGNLNILKGTAFTFVLPEKNPDVENTEGIVSFIDQRDTDRYKVLQPTTDTIKRVALSVGSDVNVNIGIDREAEFNIIIDQGTGDYVKVKGEAALNASVTPGGDLGLTGSYDLKSGAYQLNYNTLKRKFNIQSGSTIIFSGDPLDATLDITAVYTANASPYDLVEKQVPDPSQLNYYKQRLPFDVDLKLTGAIMQPSIGFDIQLPDNRTYRLSTDGVDLVRGRLTQLRNEPSEMNKQVFALLLLNRFVGEDPFASSSGTSAEFLAKQSVSRFISDQLNQYASSLIKGVDLNLDLQSSEDYTTGQRQERTDLNISASKQLLNDRLTVTVGNDFELSGPQSTGGDQHISGIPGNLSADYKLSADGKYTVRAYRTDQDAGALEGYVTETGINFIVSLDYNKFKNLFHKKRRRREQEQREKQQQTILKPKDTTDAAKH